MSKLNFSNIGEAYNIPSVGIKDTSEKIAELTKKITESAFKGPNIQKQDEEYQRIGLPDKVDSKFCKNNQSTDSDDDLEVTFFKLMKSPRFEDVVKNYIYFKHPEWLLSSNKFVPSKESFGSNTNLQCEDIKHYIIFFIVSISLYLLLSLLLKKK